MVGLHLALVAPHKVLQISIEWDNKIGDTKYNI